MPRMLRWHLRHNIRHHDMLLETAKLGEKGQIVIPKSLRQRLEIQPGDQVILLSGRHRPGVILANAKWLHCQAEELISKVEKDLDA